jgi:serine O-acetyltransferase
LASEKSESSLQLRGANAEGGTVAIDLLDQLFRDFDRMHRMGAASSQLLMDPSLWIVATYRLGHALRELPGAVRAPLLLAHRPWEMLLASITSVALPPAARIGGGLFLSRGAPIVLAPETQIGRDCNLSAGVTIASGARGSDRGAPWIGDRVYIGPGAKVIGPIRVGNDAAIGANAVVTEDVADHAIVAGVPARVLSGRGSQALVPRGRRRPALLDGVRRTLRALLPRPAQLLLRS